MSQELSFSIWSLVPWIPFVLDLMVESSVQTTTSLVKVGLATTGQKATTLRVRFTVTDGSDGIDGNDGKSNFIVNYYGD